MRQMLLVSPTTRPPRVATFINASDPHWMEACLTVVDYYSQGWGGRGHVIVPVTEGHRIDDAFLALLRLYDPDFVCMHRWRVGDLRVTDPNKYGEHIAKVRAEYIKAYGSEDGFETIGVQKVDPTVIAWESRAELDGLLAEHINDYGSSRVYHDVATGPRPFPYMSPLLEILPFTKQTTIDAVVAEGDAVHKLLVYSACGMADGIKAALVERTAEVDKKIEQTLALGEKANLEELRQKLQGIFVLGPIKVGRQKLYEMCRLAWEGSAVTVDGERHLRVPFHVGLCGLGFYSRRRRGRPFRFNRPVVVLGDAAEDFCAFTLLRGLGIQAIWVPPAMAVDRAEIGAPLQQSLHVIISHGYAERAIVTSVSLDRADVERVIESMSAYDRFDGMTEYKQLPDCVDYPSRLIERERDTSREPFEDGVSERLFSAPTPRQFQPRKDQHWIADFWIENWAVPRCRDVADAALADSKDKGAESVRITAEGISILPFSGFGFGDSVAENLPVSRLRIPGPMSAFATMFTAAGYKMWLSNKGSYMQRTVAKFGSLGEAAEFCRSGKEFELIHVCLSDERGTPGIYDEGIRLVDDTIRDFHRKYLNLQTIRKRLGDSAEEFTDKLCGKGILHRGFALKCSTCHRAEWYSLKEVGPGFDCKFCGAHSGITRENLALQPKPREEPAWCYRLDELVYRGFRENIQVPILALAWLGSRAQYGFDQVAEVSCSKGSDEFEVDICAVVDGDIVLGECTTRNRLADTAEKEKTRVAMRAILAKSLRASRFIFATTETEFSPGTRKVVAECFAGLRTKVEFACADKLLASQTKP